MIARLKEKPTCSVTMTTIPIEITCPYCGMEIEIWSDESEIECKLCGNIVYPAAEVTH